ncbi:hypothetical protein ORV05_04745 [Amycolatopsis cynarae]|uniref:PD-(D/E)XK endonuclease-like domain-containing protein n=1 Tax=Amycolatopsis cynarae TaxID=2995223 RepID=A0ABY7B454_9PSEU|nr:hypothetical protein [Amycolatopsis sp. HUAS 11-8]WAL67099.1 hypothetical protein ORV05_04745 [Amycolatopsis sp. HUAS 11-8]
MTISPADFMGSAPAPLGGNTAWASRYAGEIRRMITAYSERRPRSLQLHLGPSELGVACDRQVAGKMAGLPKTNHVSDPWPSFVGTAIHAEMENVLHWYNRVNNVMRFVAEQRVTPHPNHPGTADGYDAVEQCVLDWKALGESTMNKVRRAEGPPRKYVVQLLLYGHGYRLMGLPVKRVVLAALPRTSSSLDGVHVWERPHTPADDELLALVFQQTEHRQQLAIALHSGQISLLDIDAAPSYDECYFCPFYRPESARDGLQGCPGNLKNAQ